MRNRIRFISIVILIVCVALLIVSFISANGSGRTSFGTDLGADHAGFYTAGWMLNRYPATALYDRETQNRVHHELHPHVPADEELPYVYPPFVAVVFQPLARLPYGWSFGIWLVISLAFYAGGSLILIRHLPFARRDPWTVLLAMLSFEPFVMECWQGGQVSSVGFFCLIVAWYLDRRPESRFASGLVLGMCIYKPTLLVVALPVLLVARRWRNLLGVLTSGVALGLLSLLAVGSDGCAAFVDKLLAFSRTATDAGSLELRTFKYIDLNAATRLLFGGPGTGQRVVFMVLVLSTLGIILMRTARWANDGDRRNLIWALVFLATPILNLYVGIYDGVLVAVGTLLLADAAAAMSSLRRETLLAWLAAIYLVPWITQPIAKLAGVQLFSVLLLALVWWVCVQKTGDHERRPLPDGRCS